MPGPDRRRCRYGGRRVISWRRGGRLATSTNCGAEQFESALSLINVMNAAVEFKTIQSGDVG
jgi:hypothetical protein